VSESTRNESLSILICASTQRNFTLARLWNLLDGRRPRCNCRRSLNVSVKRKHIRRRHCPQRRGSAVESVREWSRSSVARRRIVLPPALKGYFYRPVSSSQYNTAWMWNRGTNKMLWIARMCDEDPSLVLLRRRVLRLGADGWLLSTTLPTAFLYVMPTFLAGMTR
jgi:hypothetical protein